MISFTCDYTEGTHPEILRRLSETNMLQLEGYGEDPLCQQAREKIRQATGCPQADVFFLVGGTQTNATVIDSLLGSYQGVVAVATGHVAVHEAGAIEQGGHKVLTLPPRHGKLQADVLADYLHTFYADPTWPHMVQPGMVYISHPTEYGTIYSRAELQALHAVCQQHHLPLYVDGARLAYALASPQADTDLKQLACLCDAFYIGGTKVGCLCGEAVVFPKGTAPCQFFTIVKQHGALLAKGRLLGLQFDTLFTDGLYLRMGRHAIDAAMRLKQLFADRGTPFYIDSPTNQQFPILTTAQKEAIAARDVRFEEWATLPDGRHVTRFATSWATTDAQLSALADVLSVSL